MSDIYVFGHKCPDNDSICSASAYADYLNCVEPEDSDRVYVPCCLGDIPPESYWVFERYGASDKLPCLLPHHADGEPPFTVVLVDHNEASQSADDVEDMNIIEIVDHHRIGGIKTAAPIPFTNLPYGSTGTIIAQHYMDTEVTMPTWVAGVLLSALLTDTVILKSPTTTNVDCEVCAMLAEALDLDPVDFGMMLIKKRSEGIPFSPERVLSGDLKEYEKDGLSVAIVQYENVTLDDVIEQRDAVIAGMEQLAKARGWDLFLFMATDIIKEGTELFAVGETALAEAAFEVDLSDGSVWMPGVLSRKKQVAAPLMSVRVPPRS